MASSVPSDLAPALPGRLLALARVCELLAVGERTVRRWIAAGALRAHRMPGGWRIAEDDLACFLEARATRPAAHRPRVDREGEHSKDYIHDDQDHTRSS